ncbi:MAG: GNAT family N-acetyltransferase [Pseudoruegeria sp.]
MTIEPIRTARPDDALQLVELFVAAYSEYMSEISDLPDMTEGWPEAIAGGDVWVVGNDSRIDGCLLLQESDDSLKIVNVATRPESRGQGIGGLLMRFAEAEGALRGVDRMCLSTHVKMPGNVTLYEHLGWTETERTGNKVHMEKEL